MFKQYYVVFVLIGLITSHGTLPAMEQPNEQFPIFILSPETRVEIGQLHHAAALFEIIETHRTDIGRWQPFVKRMKAVDDMQKLVQLYLDEFVTHKRLYGVIIHQNKIAGASYIFWNTELQQVLCGSFLAPEARGKGLASHARRHIIRYAYTMWGIDTFYSYTFPDNEASMRVSHALGLRIWAHST